MKEALPRWDLAKLYPSLDSDEFKADMQAVEELAQKWESYNPLPCLKIESLAKGLCEVIAILEKADDLLGSLGLYCGSFVSTNSYDTKAAKLGSALNPYGVKLSSLVVRFQKRLGEIAEADWQAFWQREDAKPFHNFKYALDEARKKARHLMDQHGEYLASALDQSGASAWGRLHGLITSRLTAPMAVNGETKILPMTAIRGYTASPDPEVRLMAHETEAKAWHAVEDQLAACLNGVKGASIVLCKERGYSSPLEESLSISRLDMATFKTMFAAMERSFPLFRRYYKSKAQKLGMKALRWCDLDAPVGDSSRKYTFTEARDFVLRQFETFGPELFHMGQRAFAENWIDAEPRDGKEGGAFCMPVKRLEESRVLANFNGSYDSVNCLAHELGHAFHNHCMKGLPLMQRHTPMTLAESASIMNEIICGNAAIKEAKTPGEELYILENMLNSTAGVIVDIASRFLFESEVMERRAKSELTAKELYEIMGRAQKATYGDGLDESCLGLHLWTWKPHYYFAGFNFYNYPYAFGRLFALALYAIYQKKGADFVPEYMSLLRDSGQASPKDLAARFGFDITKPEFWDESMATVEQWVSRFEELN